MVDLVTARARWDRWPLDPCGTPEAAVAAAASAAEQDLTGRTRMPSEDLLWSANVLLLVAAAETELLSGTFDDSIVGAAAGRSAARGLPYLLLPAAAGVRRDLGVGGPSDVDDLVEWCAATALAGGYDTMTALAQSLDAVWAAACDRTHLYGRCHHRAGLEVVQSILGRAVVTTDHMEEATLAAALPSTVSVASRFACCRDDVLAPQTPMALQAAGSG